MDDRGRGDADGNALPPPSASGMATQVVRNKIQALSDRCMAIWLAVGLGFGKVQPPNAISSGSRLPLFRSRAWL